MSDPKKPTTGVGGLDAYRAKRTGGSTPEPMASTVDPADVSPANTGELLLAAIEEHEASASGTLPAQVTSAESSGTQPAMPAARGGARMFVVHQHDATRMHYDLRLEIDGVLCSWAVPKPPSMNPDEKRLAVKVENHPLEYVHFEAVIPDGNYGAGPMIAWDRGLFRPLIDPAQGLLDGEIKFELYGYKLAGAFTLVHTGKNTRGRNSGRGSNDWLLIKKRDAPSDQFLAAGQPLSEASVLSGLTIDELAARSPRHQAIVAELAELRVPKKTIVPGSLEPMLCQVADAPFSSSDWVFELKYDGFRMTSYGGAGQALLKYRSGQDSTDRFPELTSAIRALPLPGLILDGEIVALDPEGKPDFHKLSFRGQMHRASEVQRAALTAPVTYVIFDLLGVAGYDLRNVPLLVRKALLHRVLPTHGPLRYAEHIPTHGEALLAQVVARGLEGVVAKKASSVYKSKRSPEWLKMKADPEADFAVCGYTAPKGTRTGLGALHLCVWDEERWVWAGKVGSGMDDKMLAALTAEFAPKPKWKLPFPRPEGSGDAIWIEPELVVQVRYREWPVDSALRFPVFERLRRDKHPKSCGMPIRHTGEAPKHQAGSKTKEPGPGDSLELVVDPQVREVRITRPEKLLWKDDKISKGDLIEYYRAISPWMLPYLHDRPTVLHRYPDGIDGDMFYQKDMPDWIPPWLRTTTLWSEHSQREVHYVMLDDADGLAFVANLASIPIHCWASRIAHLEHPDWTIVDLDPKNAPREWVVPLALAIHELCDAVGLPNYVKTSGQSGLHVLIPLGGQCTFEQARTLAYLIGLLVEKQHPDKATTNRSPSQRGGRVYLDWGQNAHGQLLVAPYSVRPVANAPVSMPLVWSEVTPDLDPRQFNLRNALDRVCTWSEDPCLRILDERPDLAAVLEKLGELTKDG